MIELRFQSFSAHPQIDSLPLDPRSDRIDIQARMWLEKNLIFWALVESDGNQTRAARMLDLAFGTFRARMRKYKIKVVDGEIHGCK